MTPLQELRAAVAQMRQDRLALGQPITAYGHGYRDGVLESLEDVLVLVDKARGDELVDVLVDVLEDDEDLGEGVDHAA